MNRLFGYGWCVLMGALLISVSGCSGMLLTSEPERPISHVVVVWLKDDVPKSYTQTLIKKSHQLKAIPGLTHFSVGPALHSERPVVDDSFDLALHMEFVSVDAMNVYLSHPTHVEFIERYVKDKTKKIIIYDF